MATLCIEYYYPVAHWYKLGWEQTVRDNRNLLSHAWLVWESRAQLNTSGQAAGVKKHKTIALIPSKVAGDDSAWMSLCMQLCKKDHYL
jgi:hypothetical protein